MTALSTGDPMGPGTEIYIPTGISHALLMKPRTEMVAVWTTKFNVNDIIPRKIMGSDGRILPQLPPITG